MNPTVEAALAAQFAELEATPAASTPTPPYGYGRDLSCLGDLTADCAEVDPFSRAGLSEAIVRRLTTPRGRIVDAPDYGLDLRLMLNRGTTDTTLRTLSGQIRSELTKDDRIEDVRVEVAVSSDRRTLRVVLMIAAVDPLLGEFEMVLAVSSETVVLLAA
jgi:hypothetical protein